MRPVRAALVVGASPGELIRALEERGFSVETARESADALAVYRKEDFDLCVVLVESEEKANLVGKLRRMPKERVVPIVLAGLPGGDRFTPKEAVELGADSFVNITNTDEVVEVVERTMEAIESVAPAPEDDDAVENVFELVRSIGGRSSGFARSNKKEKRRPDSYRDRSLQQLIESVEKRLSSQPEMSEMSAMSMDEEGLDVLDIEAEIEPLSSTTLEDNSVTLGDDGDSAQKDEEGDDGKGISAHLFFLPLYEVLGCSLEADKEELAKAYAVMSEKLRILKKKGEKIGGENEVRIWKNAQKALDVAFDVLSKNDVRKIVRRHMLEKEKKLQ